MEQHAAAGPAACGLANLNTIMLLLHMCTKLKTKLLTYRLLLVRSGGSIACNSMPGQQQLLLMVPQTIAALTSAVTAPRADIDTISMLVVGSGSTVDDARAGQGPGQFNHRVHCRSTPTDLSHTALESTQLMASLFLSAIEVTLHVACRAARCQRRTLNVLSTAVRATGCCVDITDSQST